MTIETKTQSGEWADLTRYMQAGGEHAPDWGPPFPDPMGVLKITAKGLPGMRKLQRQAAYRVRVLALAERLEITGGTGNFMVNLCRDGARRSAGRRADASYQRPAAGPHHPNERLSTFGISVRLRPGDEPGMPILVGGTKRQQACYRRAIARAVGA